MNYGKFKFIIWLYNNELFEKNIMMMKIIKFKGEEVFFYDFCLCVKILI